MQDLKPRRQVKEPTFVLFQARQYSWWPTDKRRPSAGQETSVSSQSGQVVLEYILLLVISVGVAALLSRQMVGRSPDSPGIITSSWNEINTAIGADIID